MATTCDHCGRSIDDDEAVEGEEGLYCPGTCCWDHEVLEVTPEELPPKPPLSEIIGRD